MKSASKSIRGVAGLDPVAILDPRGEARAFQVNRIQADMHQQLEAARGCQRQGMVRGMQHDHLAVTRRGQRLADRVQRDPVPDHLLGENRVRHAFDGHQVAGQGRS